MTDFFDDIPVAPTPPKAADPSVLGDYYARKHGVDPELIQRVMRQESRGKQFAKSPVGASGYMQLMPDTARSLGVKDIYDPHQNIDAGVRYLKKQLDDFGDVNLALAAYNAGPGAVKKYGNRVPPYRETQNYVKTIGGGYTGNGLTQSQSAPSFFSDVPAAPQKADSFFDDVPSSPATSVPPQSPEAGTATPTISQAQPASAGVPPPSPKNHQLEPGNIDLTKRPVVHNPDGTISTVRSMSVNFDGREVLIPTVSDDGRILTEAEAVDLYKRTGKHLGIFDSPEAATEYAKRLHEQQAEMYGGQGQQSAPIASPTPSAPTGYLDESQERPEDFALAEPKLKPYNPDAGLSAPAAMAQAAQRMTVRQPGYDEGILEPISATIHTAGEKPSTSQAVDALMEQLGPGWKELAQRYRSETGREPIDVQRLPEPEAFDYRERGTNWRYSLSPTRDFLDTMKAYEKGGLEEASRVATERANAKVAGMNKSAQDEAATPYLGNPALSLVSPLAPLIGSQVGEDVTKGAMKTMQGTAQLAENLRKIHEGEAFGDANQEQIDRARASMPGYRTNLGGVLGTGVEVGGDVARMTMLPGVSAPLEQFLENYHRGGYEAAKAAGSIAALEAVGIGGDKISKLLELTPVQRQVFVRALQGDVNAAQAAMQDEKGAALLKSFGIGAAFPVGKGERREAEAVAPRIAPTERTARQSYLDMPDIPIRTPEGVRVVKRADLASAESGASEAAPVAETQPAGQEAQAAPEPVRHVDLQKRDEAGQFREETPRERSARLRRVAREAENATVEGTQTAVADVGRPGGLGSLRAEEVAPQPGPGTPTGAGDVGRDGGTTRAARDISGAGQGEGVRAPQPSGLSENAPDRLNAPERGLTRNFRAGTNDATLQFSSAEQRDLYDLGAKMSYVTRGGRDRTSDRAVGDIQGLRSSLASRLNVPESEVSRLASETLQDVKAQMRGVKHLEERKVVDNVRAQTPDGRDVQTGAVRGDSEAAGASLTRGVGEASSSPAVPVGVEVAPGGERVPALAGREAVSAPTSDRLNAPVPGPTASRSFPQSAEAAGLSKGTNLTYEVQADAPAVERASARIEAQGADKVAADIARNREPSKDDVVAAQLLAKKYSEAGDHEREVAVINDLAEKLTKAGQSVQAASLISRLSPEGVLIQGQRLLNKRGANRTLTVEEATSLKETAARAREAEAKVSDLQRQIEEMKLRPQSGQRPVRSRLETFEQRLTRLETEARARLEARKAAGSQKGSIMLSRGRVNPTDTPEFKRFFEGSKVVDEKGKPRTVYHGTTKNVDAFDPAKMESGAGDAEGGFWFTSSPDEAAYYADAFPKPQEPRLAEGANIIPAHVAIKNPMVVSDLGDYVGDVGRVPVQIDGRIHIPQGLFRGEVRLPEGGRAAWQDVVKSGRGIAQVTPAQKSKIVREAKAAGHDGIIIKNVIDGSGHPSDIYVAFKPEQIKSATGNSGAFDPKNKNMLGASAIPLEIADYAIIGAVKLAKKGVTVARWTDEMVSEFGDEIKPHLRAIYQQSYAQLKTEREAARREAQERAVRRENPTVTDAKEIQRLINERLDAQTEARKARGELERTYKQLGRSPARRALATVGDTIGAARTMLTGGDVSFGLRQGKMAVRHPAMFVKEWTKAWRSLSEAQAERIRSEMELHPDFKTMQKDMGMQFTSLGHSDPAMHEEGFQSRLIAKLPIFRNVERVNAAMLDGLRFGWAKSYLDNVRKLGLDPQAEAKALKEGGELIMDGTGRADLGRALNQMTPVLSNTLFSPRFWASRVKWLTVHPTRILLPESMGGFSRPARVEAIKTLMAFTGVVATQLAVARATGAQVDTDPDSPNFLKGRWGPLRVDFSAGFQGHIRLVLRLAKTVAGQTVSSDGRPRQSGADILGTYARGKESPVMSLIHDVFLSEKTKEGQGTNIVGDPVYPFGDPNKRGYDRLKSSALFQRIAPMLYRDAQEAYELMGWKGGAVAGLGSFLGEGVNAYGDKPNTGRGSSRPSRPARASR